MDNIVSDSSKRDSNADHANSHSYQDTASPVNASQAAALREKEATATDTAHEQQTPAASHSENVSAKSDEPEKTGAKRKAKTQRLTPTQKKLRNYEQRHFDEFSREFEAEEARRAALSPEARKEEDIMASRKALQDHIKPRFLGHCRIALSPGIGERRSPAYYHVRYFENLLDVSSPHQVARFETDRWRHIPNIGAKLILEEYIGRWRHRLSQAQNHDNPSSSVLEGEEGPGADESPSNRLQPHPSTEEEGPSNSLGSSVKTAKKSEEAVAEDDKWAIGDEMYEEMREAEIEDTRQALNRFPSRWENIDGESSDWDIIEYLLPETDPEYSERHALSQALKRWEQDVLIATTEESKLAEEARQRRADLSIEKIKRYLGVYVPARGNIYYS